MADTDEQEATMRRTIAGLTVLFMGVLALAVTRAQEPQDNATFTASEQLSHHSSRAELARIARGYAINPVRLNLRGKDPQLVGLGSYIVNGQGGCNDCHTNPPFAEGGDPFMGQPTRINTAGFLAGGNAFGPFVSRNLTPDAEGRPAGLTFQQFERTIRTGIDLKQAHPEISPLLQVMPWPVYRSMTDRDLRAIYEYLRAIPHAEPVQ
jgi:hypothetical protein